MRFTAFEDGSVDVARRLLGQRLVRMLNGERLAGTIVEVEAYLGAKDRAAHTYGGRRTARNESMYLPGGHAYVYFTYGMHHCLNIVCGRRDEGVAVLVRALEPTEGLETMFAHRAAARRARDLCRGPARLTQALAVDRAEDGLDLRTSPVLFVERLRQRSVPLPRIDRTARVGVGYAGAWAKRRLRFLIRGCPYVSSA
ncbi:MAG: DNA-3-methyladenine glycosylase [Planctomycetota bacterium]|jgi:DNA-3-methyladenine glycosylase